MEAVCEKNLRLLSRSQELLTFLQSHCSQFMVFESGCFLTPEQKNKMTSIISNATQLTARGGLLVFFACDFGEWLERLVSVRTPRIFFISCFHAGYEKKGACLARIVKKRNHVVGKKILPYTHHVLSCHTGELRPGSNGWMYLNTEALDVLTIRRSERAKKTSKPPLASSESDSSKADQTASNIR